MQGLCNYKISLLVAQGRLAYNFSPWCRTEMFDARLKKLNASKILHQKDDSSHNFNQVHYNIQTYVSHYLTSTRPSGTKIVSMESSLRDQQINTNYALENC